MASIKAILYKGKKLSDGTYPVMLCLRKGAETKRFSLKFKASPKQWDDTAGLFRSDKRVNPDEILEIHDEKTNQIKTHKVGYKEKNALINRHLLNAQRIVAKFDDEKKDWTVSMFASEFSRRTTHVKFSDFINSWIIHCRDTGKVKTGILYQELVHKLGMYDKGVRSRDIPDIDRKWVQGFIDYCARQGNQPNTIGIYLRHIRTLLNEAIKQGIGSKESYPFSDKYGGSGGIKISKYKSETRKRFIPVEYLSKLKNASFGEDLHLERAQHLFFFSFYSFGMNWLDMALLKKRNIVQIVTNEGNLKDVITYSRSKTKKSYTIPLSQELVAELNWFKNNTLLFKDYLLPIIDKDYTGENLLEHVKSKRRRFSLALKKIAQQLEFPPAISDLSSYFARHSFAMALRQKGRNIDVIQAALGHSSPETTKAYLDSFDTETMETLTTNLL